MCFRIRRQEFASVGSREVANLEDRFEMLYRDRHHVHRIGDLRYERTVLSERDRQTMTRSGWAGVENPFQHALVSADAVRALALRLHAGHGSDSAVERKSTLAAARFAPPTSAGATYSERNPAASSDGMARGSPAASPQRLRSMRRARAASTTHRNSRSMAGCVGSAKSATAPISRPAAATYCVRSFEPMEKNSASN